jgi:hypothetical protein
MTEPLSWHQANAIHKAYQTRHLRAHLVNHSAPGYTTLCGRRVYVFVEPEHAYNPANKTCKQCLAILEGRTD